MSGMKLFATMLLFALTIASLSGSAKPCAGTGQTH